MKQIKKYVAISFWLVFCLFLAYQYFLDYSIKQKQAVENTHQKIREFTQELHQHELEKADITINKRGNYTRDRQLYNKIKNAYFDIEELYETNQINITSLKSSLTDSASANIYSRAQKPVNTDYKILKEIYQNNLYQNAYNLLNYDYNALYGIYCGFNKVVLMTASDTTLGFYFNSGINNIKIPKTTIEILNQKYVIDGEGVLLFDDKVKEPIIFQVNTHTKTGIIEKRYRITTPKGQKLNSFDYEEIE